MKQTIIRPIAMILVLAALAGSFSGCFLAPKPEDTVRKLETAINRLDTDMLLACLESDLADGLQALLEGDSNSLSLGTMLSLARFTLPLLPLLSSGEVSREDAPQVEFTIHSAEITESTALVDVTATFRMGSLQESMDTTFALQQHDGSWLISGIR